MRRIKELIGNRPHRRFDAEAVRICDDEFCKSCSRARNPNIGFPALLWNQTGLIWVILHLYMNMRKVKFAFFELKVRASEGCL